MSDTEALKTRLTALMSESEARQRQRIRTRAREMQDVNERLDRFHSLTSRWLVDEVVPRLTALTEVLPAERPILVEKRALAAALERDSSEEFPASAEIVAAFAHDPEIEHARLLWQVRIIPVLMQYDREAVLDVALDERETTRIVEFVEERICRFASDYLRIREPDSPYQKGRLVSDPVCGMTFHRWEAAASTQHGRQTYYFCAPECRQRFEAQPARYLGRV